MPDLFTVEEVNLMCIFNTSSRGTLIVELIEATGNFETGDPQSDAEMLDIAVAVLDKLSKMSDEDFAALELNPAYEDYDEQEV